MTPSASRTHGPGAGPTPRLCTAARCNAFYHGWTSRKRDSRSAASLYPRRPFRWRFVLRRLQCNDTRTPAAVHNTATGRRGVLVSDNSRTPLQLHSEASSPATPTQASIDMGPTSNATRHVKSTATPCPLRTRTHPAPVLALAPLVLVLVAFRSFTHTRRCTQPAHRCVCPSEHRHGRAYLSDTARHVYHSSRFSSPSFVPHPSRRPPKRASARAGTPRSDFPPAAKSINPGTGTTTHLNAG
ncbi:hypothetical protein MSAN_00140500 [Mycena sanguinolenta]|uniref:Uncharacterized protein n=1 Tax=Mycena sanguinolenta TaxID=230812 RepID=A0A8H6ZDU6_9AGAR|nr:hypothetical protein MSAN_00140500 [Mycena sanguinolenta]